MALVHPRCLAQKLSEFAAHIGELNQLLTYQPFGRDEAIRMLESRADYLRAVAAAQAGETEAVRAEAEQAKQQLEQTRQELEQGLERLGARNAQLVRERDAFLASTSWRITHPLRLLKAAASRNHHG